jgi:Flp pilus assembly protein TadD
MLRAVPGALRTVTTAVLGVTFTAVGCGRGPAPSTSTASRAVPEIVRSTVKRHPVIFLGLDGADWDLLDRYMTAGVMPNLARLSAEGTSGTIATIDPPLSPIVWTTMMTGMSALDHGILDFVQFDPVTGQKAPISGSERRAPAIWNMANAGGLSAAVFGMWATYPAEPIDGLVVSDRLFTFLYKEQAPPEQVVSPPQREAWARAALQQAERAVDYTAVHAYLPWLGRSEHDALSDSNDPYAHPVSALRRMLVETTVYRDLSLDWIRRERPDLAVVYLQATDTVGHVFAPYAPPRQPSISEADFARYSEVPARFFRSIDETIGAYRAAAEATGAVLMIASDHGFRWTEGRPSTLSSIATASAAKWHAPDGMYLMWGSGIVARSGHDGRGGVQQVCATLLALTGLPPGRDVEGDPLPGAPAVQGARADYFTRYQRAPRPAGDRPAADAGALANLRALGYIGASESGSAPAGSLGSTRTPGSYNNEGLILRARNKMPQAIEAFEKALSLDPNLASAAWNLSDMLYARGQDLDRSDALLLRSFAGGLPDGRKIVIGRAMAYQRNGQLPRSLALMDRAVETKPAEPDLWLFRGRYRVEGGDCSGATNDVDRAIALAPANASAYSARGVARLCAGDRAGARAAFERSLRIDPEQPNVRHYLATLR